MQYTIYHEARPSELAGKNRLAGKGIISEVRTPFLFSITSQNTNLCPTGPTVDQLAHEFQLYSLYSITSNLIPEVGAVGTEAQSGWRRHTEDDLEIQSLLSLHPECWSYKPVPLCPVCMVLRLKLRTLCIVDKRSTSCATL